MKSCTNAQQRRIAGEFRQIYFSPNNICECCFTHVDIGEELMIGTRTIALALATGLISLVLRAPPRRSAT